MSSMTDGIPDTAMKFVFRGFSSLHHAHVARWAQLGSDHVSVAGALAWVQGEQTASDPFEAEVVRTRLPWYASLIGARACVGRFVLERRPGELSVLLVPGAGLPSKALAAFDPWVKLLRAFGSPVEILHGPRCPIHVAPQLMANDHKVEAAARLERLIVADRRALGAGPTGALAAERLAWRTEVHGALLRRIQAIASPNWGVLRVGPEAT